jgi:uncharacterized membrane protein
MMRGPGLQTLAHAAARLRHGNSVALALLGSDTPVLINGQRCVAVLIPTAPVPVGGGLIYVPEHWITPADVGVEAVTSIYVSMGLTSPQYLQRADGSAKLTAPEKPPRAT